MITVLGYALIAIFAALVLTVGVIAVILHRSRRLAPESREWLDTTQTPTGAPVRGRTDTGDSTGADRQKEPSAPAGLTSGWSWFA